MARLTGLIGSGRGKLGTVVLSKGDKGMTYARSYQPQVKNPRTYAQLVQRAKVNLAGQISKVTSAETISALAGNSVRANRSRYMSYLLKSMTTQGTEDVTAQIDYKNMKFGEGSAVPQATITGEPVITETAIRLNVNVNTTRPEEVGDRYIIGILSDNSQSQFDLITHTDQVYTASGATTIDIVPGTNLEDGQTIAIWRIPFEIADTASYVRAMALYGDTTKAMATLGTGRGNAVNYGDSQFLGAYPFVSAVQ